MSETSQFEIPLLAAAQSQKHITVNEALARLDALAQIRIQSLGVLSPPLNPLDGTCYSVPNGATGVWNGQEGLLAIFANGGWEFVTPKEGWRAWLVDQSQERVFDGANWAQLYSGNHMLVNQQPFGSAFCFALDEYEHAVTAGNTNDLAASIPDYSWITAISFRVVEEVILTGASSWRLGTDTNSTQFGTSLPTGLNEVGFTATTKRFYFYPNTPIIRLQAGSGDFESGKIRFAIHTMCYTPPDPV